MHKKFLSFLLIIIILGFAGLDVFAATAPTVEFTDNQEIVKAKGQTTFDVKTLFTINPGSYTHEDLTVAYTLSRNDVVIEHEDLVIDFVAGDYTLTVLIVGNGVSIGAPVVKTMHFKLLVQAPSFANQGAMQGVKTINVQKNQGFIDLRILYKVNGNSFSEDEYSLSFDAKYPGRVVEIFGYYIKAISGVYTLTITIHSKDGSFPDVVSVPLTVIVQKERPQVVFEYENETGKTVIEDEHTVYLFNGTKYIDLTEFYTVYGNAYVANEYSANLIVKKLNENGYENWQVFDGLISPVPGIYSVVVKVNPKIQGAFTPVTSRTLILHVEKALPKVNARSLITIRDYDAKGRTINMANHVSLANSAYAQSQFKVEYEFVRDGKTISSKDGIVSLKNGEYEVTAKVISLNDEFAPQETQFQLAVVVPMEPLVIIAIAAGSVLVLSGLGFVLFRKLRCRHARAE
jgi:outer membrane lipoprotein-sorting protein